MTVRAMDGAHANAFDVLRDSATFSALADESIHAIADNAEWMALDADTVLFHAGEPGDCMYLLATGRLDVFKTDAAGIEVPLGRVLPGEVVGEMALLDGESRSATVRAARDATLLRISRAATEELSKRSPAALLALCRLLATRLRRTYTPQVPKQPILCVVPVSPHAPIEHFSEALLQQFQKMGRRNASILQHALHTSEQTRFEATDRLNSLVGSIRLSVIATF